MDTLNWLSKLIAFNTTSHLSNLELIAEIQSWMDYYHVPSRITSDLNEPKANLFATLPANNGSPVGGLILSGHTDVVPVDGQAWDTDPFTAIQIDNRIYGRGACDMKGFIAVTLALLPELKALSLPFPLHFAFTYDEEIGCRGAPSMIVDLQQAGIEPSACIVGEPTEMRPVIAHKGIHVYRAQINGLSAHSSLTPKGCNAIEYAAKLINYIRQVADDFKDSGPFDNHFDVPFTSVSVNMIKGGIAHNTIPSSCEFFFEFRHLPQIKPNNIIDKINYFAQQTLLAEMHREYKDASIVIDKIAAVPSFESESKSIIERLSQEICHETEQRKVAYATEAGLFQEAQIPTIVCGPGSIEQAHRANEFVTVQQLNHCSDFLLEVVNNFSTHKSYWA